MSRWELFILALTLAIIFALALSTEQTVEAQPVPIVSAEVQEEKVQQATTQDIQTKRISAIASKYNSSEEYLVFILEIEKEFGLEPCRLLALIAAESGFTPQTHMDGGSLSYNTTQMKLPTAKTAHMAMTEYYKMDVPYPTHELLDNDKYYATLLAGGYLKYLNDVYKDADYMESYTAYNWGISGRMTFYNQNGHFRSPYAIKVTNLQQSFKEYIEY